MRILVSVTFALSIAISLASSPARAATCQTDSMTCPTTMPAGGYCECKSRGTTQQGTVVEKAGSQKRGNGTAGGCGANPDAAGCR